MRRFACLATIIMLLAFASPLFAAHTWPQTDYSPKNRIGLEVAFGKMQKPVQSDFLHYLFNIDYNLIENLHLRFGFPFSGYSGAYGKDNFIRGNIMFGASYMYPVTGWLQVGGSLKIFTPTYEKADPPSTGLGIDPRAQLLSHWNYRFQYALEDYFPFSPEVSLRLNRWNLFTQFDFGFTYAVEVEDDKKFQRDTHFWMLHYAASIGYDFWGYVELASGVSALVDPDDSGQNLRAFTGNPYAKERTQHAFDIMLRGQYKWAALIFAASVPLEEDFRNRLDPYYHFTFQTEFF